MAKGPPISEDKKWKIEEDARTLARAEEIRGDKKRHAAACVELKNQAKVADKEAKIKAGLAAAFPKDK